MASQRHHHLLFAEDEEDYDDYDDEDDDEEEDDWGLSSSPSPVAHQPNRLALDGFGRGDPSEARSGVLKTLKPILSSPQCSMDDDSSTESEGEVAGGGLALTGPGPGPRGLVKPGRTTAAASAGRRGVSKHEAGIASSGSRIVSTPTSFTSSEQQPGDLEQAQVAAISQRKARIKELVSKYHHECLAHCRELLALQRQWRQELQAEVPGLVSFDLPQQEEIDKQKDVSPSKSEVQIESPHVAVPKAKPSPSITPDFSNVATADVSSSLKGTSKGPLRRHSAWRGNEREALRRGILMFGLGRSEKVRVIMRGLLKQMRHGLGDIADCCWEFVRACSVHSDQKERAYVEKLLGRAKDLGIEMGPEVTECVGQWERMEKSGSVWLKRIRLLDNLGNVVRLCANPETQEAAYSAIDSLGDATLPCEWWSRESDLALLAGIYKHGFGSYEALRTDDQFSEAFRTSVEGKRLSSAVASGRRSKAEFLYHNWETSGNERVLPNARLKGHISSDADQRSSHNFSERDVDVRPIIRDEDGDSSWPDSNTLTRRLKRLVEHIGRIGQQAVKVEKGSTRKAREGRTWSKREKLNFLRILLTWGLPVTPGQGQEVCWQFFKDQASVRPLKNKKESSLEACYEGLVKEMTQLLEGSDSQEDKPQLSGSMDQEGSSDESAEKHNIDIGAASQAGPAVLTQKSAVRLRDRLELFETLRQALDLYPDDWRNLGLAIHQSHTLPSWWQIGTHDRQLVLGVLKHGFGNWDAIFEDKTYSFKADSDKEKFRRGITQDGDTQSFDPLWGTQASQEGEDHVKSKGKRNLSQGGSSHFPSPKSCVKRLKFVGNMLRR